MSRAVDLILSLAVLTAATPALADDGEPAYPAPLEAPPPPAPLLYPAPQVPYTPAPGPYAQPQPYPAPTEGPKSSTTAAMLSIAATIAPPLLALTAYSNRSEADRDSIVGRVALASVMIGPSVGQLYAGKVVTVGLGVRLVGFAVAMSAASSDDDYEAIGRIMIGGIGILSGAIADLATVGRSVREYNTEHFVPTITPVVDPNGSIRPQVGLAGSF